MNIILRVSYTRQDVDFVRAHIFLVYSADTPVGLSLLAAHLYYKALLLVPALIRDWLADCRDRQLSLTVTNYTSTYFSPAIVRAELAQVKDPSLAGDLSDENFTVKVANAVNEVTAAFAVDEYSLELKLKLPTDFPLHTITMRDSNRIGVTEDRWRAWILGIQQILSFRVSSKSIFVYTCRLVTFMARTAERKYRRWPRILQEECDFPFRRPIRVCDLLLVRVTSSSVSSGPVVLIAVQDDQRHGWQSSQKTMQDMQAKVSCRLLVQGMLIFFRETLNCHLM